MAVQCQIQGLQCAAGVVGLALGPPEGLGRWFVGDAVLPVFGDFQRRSQHSTTTALIMPWGSAMSNAASKISSRLLGACTGMWFVVEVAVLPVCEYFQRRRLHLAITAHRAMPACELPQKA